MKNKIWIIVFFLSFANSIYMRFWPLVVFGLAVIGLEIYIRLFPTAKWLKHLSFNFGTAPRIGEKESQYLFRLSLVMFSAFLVFISFMLTISYISSEVYRRLQTSGLIMGISFALTLLAGTGLLGGIICLTKGFWLRLRGNDRYYSEENEEAT
ncbi:MAG: hypothetical protein HZA11_00945 [Nitrospirae bacterium]|nr:hypothetical protein [Nitrospirota bacterium]